MNRVPLPKYAAPGVVAVPTSLTPITSTDSQIVHLIIANASGASRTILVQDAAGNAIVPTVTVADKTNFTLIMADGDCIEAKSGVSWQASGAGLTGEYFIRYR